MKKISALYQTLKGKAVKFAKGLKADTTAMLATLSLALPSASALSTLAAANANVNEDDLFNNVLDIIFKIFRYIGILLLAWSVGMLVLAFKNEDADSKSRAMMMAVVSIVLVGIQPIIEGVLNI